MNAHLKKRLLNAKDSTPIERVSMRRLVEAARQACLDLKRLGRKIIVSLGKMQRVFQTLREAWEFLAADDWAQLDLFPNLPGHTPKVVDKPISQKNTLCKFCSGAIALDRALNGRWIPMNNDGSRHRCNPIQSDALSIPF